MSVKKIVFAFILAGAIAQSANSQTPQDDPINDSGFQLSLRGGYDIFPDFRNNTPYIDYKGGLMLGLSLDYYWKWFGIGADVDYLKNQPRSTYPTGNLVYFGSNIRSFVLDEASITRLFYGIGPNFKFQPSNRFAIEAKLRGGAALLEGGRTLLQGEPVFQPAIDLNFHAGYDQHPVLSAKGQLSFTYFLNDYIGLHAGGYYMHHFSVKELQDPVRGISAGYQPFVSTAGADAILDPGLTVRTAPCDCEVSSIGAFAGITLRFPPAKSTPEKCSTCDNFSLTVTARDKFTKELLANTDVALKNMAGEVVRTGTTNNFGVVSFINIPPNDYAVSGILFEAPLDGTGIVKSEFRPNETLQKEILYSDVNFILKGKVVMCNSTIPIRDVSVVLKNTNQPEQKNTLTDANGEFVFRVKQQTEYDIYGKKEQFFSQTEHVSTASYSRNTTLFVKLEICMEQADCDKAIVLKNIHYDLDKYFLREEAKAELRRLAQFMVDNPGIRVELRSHTDARGTHAYNETLSQNRANAAVDYLVSQGIGRDRLVGKGYGETKLLNECADGVTCPEDKHQLNRRTEMKVICPGRN